MERSKKKEIARKMRRDPDDSDNHREFSRYDKENKRPLFRYEIGTYKKVGERYNKQKD